MTVEKDINAIKEEVRLHPKMSYDGINDSPRGVIIFVEAAHRNYVESVAEKFEGWQVASEPRGEPNEWRIYWMPV